MPQIAFAELSALIFDQLRSPSFCRASFAGATRSAADCPWLRIIVRPVEIQNAIQLQFSYYDAKKHITKNYVVRDLEEPIAEALAYQFAGIHLNGTTEEIDIRTSKKGKFFLSQRAIAAKPASDRALSHNRVKEVPLPEGRADRLLIGMGIQNPDGRIRATMRAKYTQINEFLKQLQFALETAELKSLGRTVRILDCGCGSSYLTLAAHYYLNDILQIPAELLGVDINEELIRKSTERAEVLGRAQLNFTTGRIGELQTEADVVLALHACDTATDDAILQALRSNAKIFLGAPCCHHHLNQQLRETQAQPVLRPVLAHGIFLQRTADLLTDSFRALALQYRGYKTDIIEFVGSEHTPRNIMIRAIRQRDELQQTAKQEYDALCSFWNVRPYIDAAFAEPESPQEARA